MFMLFYLRLLVFTYVYHCSLMFTLFLPLFTRACLKIFTHVCNVLKVIYNNQRGRERESES